MADLRPVSLRPVSLRLASLLPLAALLALGACGRPDPDNDGADASATVGAASAEQAQLVDAPAPSGPDITACEPYVPQEGDPELARKDPLPLPRSLRGLAMSDLDHIAVTTLAGSTYCVPTHEMETIEPPTLSVDRRFLGFGWNGNEAGGYMLIDRAGTGSHVDTGRLPVPSPSGRGMASVEWSESGFGSLNGILVLAILPERVKELARITDLPRGEDWRIDRWTGDHCFEVSYLPPGTIAGGKAAGANRRIFRAVRDFGGWKLGKDGSSCSS